MARASTVCPDSGLEAGAAVKLSNCSGISSYIYVELVKRFWGSGVNNAVFRFDAQDQRGYWIIMVSRAHARVTRPV